MDKALLLACLVLTFIASCADSLLVVALFGIPGMVCGLALILRAQPKRKTALTAATVRAAQKKGYAYCVR